MAFRHDIVIKLNRKEFWTTYVNLAHLDSYVISGVRIEGWGSLIAFAFHEHDDEVTLIGHVAEMIQELREKEDITLMVEAIDWDGVEGYHEAEYCDPLCKSNLPHKDGQLVSSKIPEGASVRTF